MNPVCFVEETFLLEDEVPPVFAKALLGVFVGLDHIIDPRLGDLRKNDEKPSVELKLTFE